MKSAAPPAALVFFAFPLLPDEGLFEARGIIQKYGSE
jgi:hypothetical protein